jgi:UDP-N-acetylmuramate--alanine ligase
MYQIDFKKPIYVHFIGIGGISMSGLAEILMNEGFRVSGSDMKSSELTDNLEKKGAVISIGQKAENISDPDLVVYTAAIHPDNPEYAEAVKKGIPMLSRAELLGEIMANYGEAVNVSGTHGKTTTTSMITDIMLEAGKEPTVTVGGMLDAIGGNIKIGKRDLFIAEACEYTNSFLSFHPTIAVILNVEADHLDFFKDIDDIRSSFKRFALTLPQDDRGYLIINGDIRDVSYFTDAVKCGCLTFGKAPGCDLTAADIEFDDKACASYSLIVKGENKGRVVLSVPGEHNVYNSLAAIGVGLRLGIGLDTIIRALKGYTGTKRRFELKGNVRGFDVIDDYAHHPQEIEATLKAAAMYPHKKLFVVFQPHTYTRTKALLNEFADALCGADEVILADIYAAREKNTIGISSGDLADLIAEKGGRSIYIPDFESIKEYIYDNVKEGDLLITMGAGNVVDIADQLVKE